MMQQAIFRKASWMMARRSKRTRNRLKLCSQAIVRSTTQRVLPSPLPCGSPRRAISVAMPAACSGLRYLSWSYPRSPWTMVGFDKGRPRLPRIGGIASISGSSWVMSLRLAPVSISDSGMPCASVRRWCFEPGRARSVGLGPVFDPTPLHGWRRNRRRHVTNRGGPLHAAWPGVPRASGPKRRPSARYADVASSSCQSHNPFPGAASPKECRTAGRKGCP